MIAWVQAHWFGLYLVGAWFSGLTFVLADRWLRRHELPTKEALDLFYQAVVIAIFWPLVLLAVPWILVIVTPKGPR